MAKHLVCILILAAIHHASLLTYFNLSHDSDKKNIRKKQYNRQNITAITKVLHRSKKINKQNRTTNSIKEDTQSNSDSIRLLVNTKIKTETFFSLGKKRYSKKDWSTALHYFKSMELSPFFKIYKDPATLLTGLCYFNLKRYNQANEYFKKINSTFPEIEDYILFTQAEIMFLQKKYSQALRLFKDFDTKFPSHKLSSQVLIRLIECNIAQGNSSLASKRIGIIENNLNNTISSQVPYNTLLMLKSKIHQHKKEYAKEAKLLSQLKLRPDAIAYFSDIDKRLTKLKSMNVVYKPKYGLELLDHVRQLQKVWSHTSVVSLVDSLQQKYTKNHRRYRPNIDQWLTYYKAYSYFRLINFKVSDSLVTNLILEIDTLNDTRFPRFLFLSARNKLRSGNITESIEMLNALYKRFPHNTTGKQAHYLAIWAYAEHGNFDRALSCLESFTDWYRHSLKMKKKLHWMQAWFTYRKGNFETAYTLFEKIKKKKVRNPHFEAAQYWSARCLQKMGKKSQAKEQFTRIVTQGNYSYYQLAASQQLMRNGQNSKKIEPQVYASLQIQIDFDTGVHIPANNTLNHLRNWEKIIYRDSIISKLSLQKLRQCFRIKTKEFNSQFLKRGKNSYKRIQEIADTYKSLYPSLAQALFWLDLGDMDKSGEAFMYFINTIINEKQVFDKTLTLKNSHISITKTNDIDSTFEPKIEFFVDSNVSSVSESTIDPLLTPSNLVKIENNIFEPSLKALPLMILDTIQHKVKPTFHEVTQVSFQKNLQQKILINQSLKDFNTAFYMDIFTLLLNTGYRISALKVFHTYLSNKNLPELTPEIRKQIYFPVIHSKLVQKYADKYSISDDLTFSIMRCESFYDSLIISSASAIGLMQILQSTGENISQAMMDSSSCNLSLFNAEKNIKYGTWYLSKLLEQYNGQWPLAIASYNAGPANVISWVKRQGDLTMDEFIESIRFSETQNYVKKVLQTSAIYRWLYCGAFTSWDVTRKIDPMISTNIQW